MRNLSSATGNRIQPNATEIKRLDFCFHVRDFLSDQGTMKPTGN
jgi:hypothetical protein